ncbi:MAG TPA: hypothetical protein PLL69_06865 [Gemmatimonadales bacterium]|nr:hypothetical protein [Gemmatimonadales bacterium]
MPPALPLLLALQAPIAAQSARSGPDAVFEQGARAVWIALSDLPPGSPDDSIPIAIAHLAGLSFQARPDRLTPDLDSALALSVMSGGKLRNTPWGWFALARQLQRSKGNCAEATIYEWNTHCRRVFDAYRFAINVDSAFVPVLGDITAIIGWPLLWAEPEVELRQLTTALEQPDLPLRVRAVLTRTRILVATDLGFAGESISGLPEAIAVLSNGELAFLRSRMLARSGNGVAAEIEYANAAADAGPGDYRAWIRADVALIGTPTELSEWDSLPSGGHGRWARDFWESRDFRDGRGPGPGSRIVEHSIRWQRLFREYRSILGDERLRIPPGARQDVSECPAPVDDEDLTGFVLQCTLPDWRDLATVFDDRGRAYIRHGEPARRAKYSGIESMTDESWLYLLPCGFAAIHFSKGPNPLLPRGMSRRVITQGDAMAACQVQPRYCTIEARKSMGIRIPPEVTRQFSDRSAEQQQRILESDGAPQRFDNTLRFNAGSYGLGRSAGTASLAVDLPLAA